MECIAPHLAAGVCDAFGLREAQPAWAFDAPLDQQRLQTGLPAADDLHKVVACTQGMAQVQAGSTQGHTSI